MIYISTVKTLPEIPELNEEDSLYILYKNTETVKMADVEILCNMLSKKHFEEFEDKNDMLVVFGIILSQLKEDEDCILVDNTLPIPKRFEDRVKKLAKQTRTSKKKSTVKRTAKKEAVEKPPKAEDKKEDVIPAKEASPLEAHAENPYIHEIEDIHEIEGAMEIAFGDKGSEKTLDKPTEIKDEPMEIAFGSEALEEVLAEPEKTTKAELEEAEEILAEPEKIATAEPEEPEDIFAGLIDDPMSVPDDAPEKLQELIKADAPDDYPFPESMFYMDVAQTIATAKSDAEIETELTALNNGKNTLWEKVKPVLTKAKVIVGKSN